MKQTAVEWLEGQILNLMSFDTIDFRKEFREKIEQAKEMEKEQIVKAYESLEYRHGENYYKETFNKSINNKG